MERLLVPLRLLIGVGLIWGSVRWAIAAEERRGPSMLPDTIGHGDKWSGQFDGDCGHGHHDGDCGGHGGGDGGGH